MWWLSNNQTGTPVGQLMHDEELLLICALRFCSTATLVTKVLLGSLLLHLKHALNRDQIETNQIEPSRTELGK